MPIFPDSTPQWLQGLMDPSVLDSPERQVARGALKLMGADNPQGQAMGTVGTSVMAPSPEIVGALSGLTKTLPWAQSLVEGVKGLGPDADASMSPAVKALVSHLDQYQAPAPNPIPSGTGGSLARYPKVNVPEGFSLPDLPSRSATGYTQMGGMARSPELAQEAYQQEQFRRNQQSLKNAQPGPPRVRSLEDLVGMKPEGSSDFRVSSTPTVAGRGQPGMSAQPLREIRGTAPDVDPQTATRIQTLGRNLSPTEIQMRFPKLTLDQIAKAMGGTK